MGQKAAILSDVIRRAAAGSLGVWVLAGVLASSCKGRSSVMDSNAETGGEPSGGGNGGTTGGDATVGGSHATGGNAPAVGGTATNGAGKGGRGTVGGASSSGATGGSVSATGGAEVNGGVGGEAGSGDAAGSGETTSTGGTPSEAGAGGSAPCPDGDSPTLVPDSTGWVDRNDDCNDVGVQGYWYPYGDQYTVGYGDARCVTLGQHLAAECSVVAAPDPSVFGFANELGVMHTVGTIAKILPCADGVTTSGCPSYDYSNMAGAGIGFDLYADRAPATRKLWDPEPYGVIGIEFTIDAVPLHGLRVEFPMLLEDADAAADTPPLPAGSTTEQHSALNPYWGAQKNGDSKYPNSPVLAGSNRILWADIQAPKVSAYAFNSKRILGVRFHVPATTQSASTYDFAISKLTFVRP